MKWYQKLFFFVSLRGPGREAQRQDFPPFCQKLNDVCPRPWATPVLMLAVLGVYSGGAIYSGTIVSIPDAELLHLGASSTRSVLVYHEIWRVLTSNLLNEKLAHVLIGVVVIGSCGLHY
jgi:hypothetical protein